VPELAAANYWSTPTPADLGDWRADRAVADLVQRLAPRRVSTQEGLTEIAAFARTLSSNRGRELALAFRGLLDESNSERARLIEELEEIGHRQRELADLVSRLATELRTIPANATGDAAARRIDLEQRHDFTERNFEEIQRTIRYACEAPVALDARLGAWARALQQAAAR
jgi:chromosome segregation ATPase